MGCGYFDSGVLLPQVVSRKRLKMELSFERYMNPL